MELLFSQYFPSCGSRYICYPRPTRQSILGVNNNSPLDWARQNISQTDFAVVVVRRALSLHYIYIVFSNTASIAGLMGRNRGHWPEVQIRPDIGGVQLHFCTLI